MRIEELRAGYNKKTVVNAGSLEIKRGEIISLIGPNGGGKSTLLKTITGELSAVAGTVFIADNDIKKIPLKDLSKKISIVHTKRPDPQHMTAFDVVLAGRLPYSDGFGLFKDKDYELAKEACALMKIEEFSDKDFLSLSDGQKQRVLIARAICQGPEFLVMDEPTTYLDIRYRLELAEVLKSLRGRGVTIIMSVHELELALMISDRVLCVRNDKSAECHSPGEILENEMLKDLYGLDDEMYEKVRAGLGNVLLKKTKDTQTRHSSCFVNRSCEYFPCHNVPEDEFNCLFCYCPLYFAKDCKGNYTYTDKGVKTCINCDFPHRRENYSKVIKRLKEEMYGKDPDREI